MKIKKIGHCCLLITLPELTILTDPGAYTTEQNILTGIDVILITHEHADHLHVASLHTILTNNPHVKIITNTAVAKILDNEGIPCTILEDKHSMRIQTITIEAYDGNHEEIFEKLGQVQNTGFLINQRLFYPGDSYIDPHTTIEILALPVAGPWCRIADAIRYALRIQPQYVFPVHDGMLQIDKIGGAHAIPQKVLESHSISFIPLKNTEETAF